MRDAATESIKPAGSGSQICGNALQSLRQIPSNHCRLQLQKACQKDLFSGICLVEVELRFNTTSCRKDEAKGDQAFLNLARCPERGSASAALFITSFIGWPPSLLLPLIPIRGRSLPAAAGKPKSPPTGGSSPQRYSPCTSIPGGQGV